MGGNANLVSEWSGAIGAIYSVMQPTFKRGSRLGWQRGVDAVRWDEEPIEVVVLVALRKTPGAPSIFSGARQRKLQREILPKMRGKERISTLLPLKAGYTFV